MDEFFMRHRKKIIGAVIAIVTVLVAWWIIYSVFVFHPVRVSPGGPVVSVMIPRVSVEFNKELTSEDLQVTINDPSIKIESYVDGRTLNINIRSILSPGSVYTFTVSSVKSTSGDVVKNHQFTISTRATETDTSLTKEQLDIILERQQATKDPVINDPIVSSLPYNPPEGDYYIDALTGQGTDKPTVRITVFLSRDDLSNRDSVVQSITARARAHLAGIQGIDISSYEITEVVQAP